MMDQLASIGIGFEPTTIDKIFQRNVRYYLNPPPDNENSFSSIFSRAPTPQWAIGSVYLDHRPVRPWGLGKIYESLKGFYLLSGKRDRTPGLYHRVDPNTGRPTQTPLRDTNERIHRSARIRLELDGLGYDDVGLYRCEALLGMNWRPVWRAVDAFDPIPPQAVWNSQHQRPYRAQKQEQRYRWVWEYVGPRETAPFRTYMVEELLGPYERQLLLLNKGISCKVRFVATPRSFSSSYL